MCDVAARRTRADRGRTSTSRAPGGRRSRSARHRDRRKWCTPSARPERSVNVRFAMAPIVHSADLARHISHSRPTSPRCARRMRRSRARRTRRRTAILPAMTVGPRSVRSDRGGSVAKAQLNYRCTECGWTTAKWVGPLRRMPGVGHGRRGGRDRRASCAPLKPVTIGADRAARSITDVETDVGQRTGRAASPSSTACSAAASCPAPPSC